MPTLIHWKDAVKRGWSLLLRQWLTHLWLDYNVQHLNPHPPLTSQKAWWRHCGLSPADNWVHTLQNNLCVLICFLCVFFLCSLSSILLSSSLYFALTLHSVFFIVSFRLPFVSLSLLRRLFLLFYPHLLSFICILSVVFVPFLKFFSFPFQSLIFFFIQGNCIFGNSVFGFLETLDLTLFSSFPGPAADCEVCVSSAGNLWMNVAAV